MPNKDKLARLKQETVQMLDEINRLRTKDMVKDKKFFARLLKGTRGLLTINEEVSYLAKFYLTNRRKVK